MYHLRCAALGVGVIGLAFCSWGCETSSHKSVSTYEYDGSGRSARPARDEPPTETEREEDLSDYEMVAPGEMAAPGEMVVEPRRK